MNATLPRPVVTVPPAADMLTRCAWCDDEAGFKCVGNVSHAICPRHLVSNLVFYNRKDTVEALYYTIISLIAEGQQ